MDTRLSSSTAFFGVPKYTSATFRHWHFRSISVKAKAKYNPKTFIVASSDTSVGLASQPTLAASLCDAADDFIDKFIDKPLRPSVDPKFVLAGNYAPVQETPPTDCFKLQGTLPACLNGVYIRNGPNPRYLPRGAHHLNDGDGMLHAVRIKDGRATFCSRFVHTDKFLQEESAGRPLFPKVFAGFYGFAGVARGALVAARGVLGVVDHSYASGLANTSVLCFDNRLMALGESGMPYAFTLAENGDIQNNGRHDFAGKLSIGMTAHPKIDPSTGELFAFRYAFTAPFLNFFRVSAQGEKQQDVPISSMIRPAFIHDFAITANYAIFPDTQIIVDPMEMIFRNGSPIVCDRAKVPRLGIIPRYASDDSAMVWFDVPGLNVIHTVNAWEENGGDEVILIATNSEPVECVLEDNHLLRLSVEKIRMNLKTGNVSRMLFASDLSLELGVVNPRYVAKKNRYAYVAIGAPFPKARGVCKLDLEAGEECIVASRDFGENCFGGEVYFVERSDNEEDDGYIVGFVHDEREGISKLLVMDAQSPTLETVGSLELPGRVPYGFHGLFVREDQLS